MLARYLTIAAAGLILTGCGGTEVQRQSPAAAPVSMRTIALQKADWPNVYEATGTVRARTTAVLSSRVMGDVREVNVRAGDGVRRGQTLILLDSRELEAGLRQAEAARAEAHGGLPEAESAIAAAQANLDLSEATFRRMKDLYEKRSISNQEFDEVSAKVKLAKAGHEMALAKKTQLESKIVQADQSYREAAVMRSYAEIAAPFDGIVTERTAEPGSLAAPGQPLLTVEQSGVYRLEANVEESKLASVGIGERVPVKIDALGRSLEGRVAEIVPAIDAAARAFTVRIDLPGVPGLRSGVFGRASFATSSRGVIAVPKDAVEERGQLHLAYVVDSGKAHARLITTGEARDGQIEALSGLNAGERIVCPIPPGLTDDAPVEVR